MMSSVLEDQPPPWMITTQGSFFAPSGMKTSYFRGLTPGWA